MMARVSPVVVIEDPLTKRNAPFYSRFYHQPLMRLYFTDTEMNGNRPLLDDVFALKHAASMDMASSGLAQDGHTPVFENPNTPRSANWYARTYNAHLVALIRHPIQTIRYQMRYFRMPIVAHHSAAHPYVRERLSPKAFGALGAAVAGGDEFRMRMAQMFVRYLPLIEGWPGQGVVVSYESVVADDLSELEFLAELDPDWQTKLRSERDRPPRSTVSTTQGTFRTGVAEFSDKERACLAQMVKAFDEHLGLHSKMSPGRQRDAQ
ncbi:hypothetical protein [Tateyamaria sp. Alg231-49]|uniref:hypothetical protein n=1 Tax=Tateyamaria sp. Alg231-49 TaxID=1922219 RepID=UPI001F1E1833|nr:hypothetical protein [Tateyamaria sp. Alg231-49]